MASSASLAVSAGAPLKVMVTPSRPLARAVAIPSRKPPNAVAKTMAGKYGVKNTSGRISDRPHRARVVSARQATANPMLKAGEGRDVPCQPCRNSLINFAMRHNTSHRPIGEFGTGPR